MNIEKTGMFILLSLSIGAVISGAVGINPLSHVFVFAGDHHDHGDNKCKNNNDNNCNDKLKTQRIQVKNDCQIKNENEDHSKKSDNENTLDCTNRVQNHAGVSTVPQGGGGNGNNMIIKLNVINDNGGTAIPSDFKVLVYLGDSAIEIPDFSFPGDSDGTALRIPLDRGIHVFFQCDNLNKCANYPTSPPEGDPGDVPEGHEVCENDPLHTDEIRTCIITTDDPP